MEASSRFSKREASKHKLRIRRRVLSRTRRRVLRKPTSTNPRFVFRNQRNGFKQGFQGGSKIQPRRNVILFIR